MAEKILGEAFAAFGVVSGGQSRLTSIASRPLSLDFHGGYSFILRIARVTLPP
jgi:hypothetical protein